MGRWTLALGGLLVWTAHFFLSYGAASIFPGSPVAIVLAILVTLAALVAGAALLWLSIVRTRRGADQFERWLGWLGAGTASLALIAVLWQGLPALLV